VKIFGAGLAGLLAANIFQRATVLEAGAQQQVNHRAVLRFRSSAVGDAVGVEFRPVTVHKGVWSGGGFIAPTIRAANQYSLKVIGRLADRSIWNLDPAQRFIAPRDLVAQMAERCASRIAWNTPATASNVGDDDVISTIPMPALSRGILKNNDAPEFKFSPIRVQRWTVANADVFQTIYFPDPDTAVYRASITGDLLIVESINGLLAPVDVEEVFRAFGFAHAPEPLDSARQQFGKIAPIDDQWRRNFILRCTLMHRIYSVGRFATWRNILLDDVLHDLAVVKRLISGGEYAAKRHS